MGLFGGGGGGFFGGGGGGGLFRGGGGGGLFGRGGGGGGLFGGGGNPCAPQPVNCGPPQRSFQPPTRMFEPPSFPRAPILPALVGIASTIPSMLPQQPMELPPQMPPVQFVQPAQLPQVDAVPVDPNQAIWAATNQAAPQGSAAAARKPEFQDEIAKLKKKLEEDYEASFGGGASESGEEEAKEDGLALEDTSEEAA
jgi:hypothetical protein